MEMGRDLREVLAEGEKDGGDILRKLLELPGLVASMSEHMACRVLHISGRDADLSDNSRRGQARYIRSARQDDNYGASNIVLPCPGS